MYCSFDKLFDKPCFLVCSLGVCGATLSKLTFFSVMKLLKLLRNFFSETLFRVEPALVSELGWGFLNSDRPVEY